MRREQAGISTTERNRVALRLMLGYAGAAIFSKQEAPVIIPCVGLKENRELVIGGCRYAHSVASYAADRNFAVPVVSW